MGFLDTEACLEFSPPVAAPPLSRLSEVPLRPSTPPACRHQASPAGRRASLGARCASSTHGCHGTRTRVPLEETSRTQVRPAGSARAAHVVQIRLRGSHGVRLRVPLQGIPLIQVRPAGGAGRECLKEVHPIGSGQMPSGQFESMGEFIGHWVGSEGMIGSICPSLRCDSGQ